MRVLSHRKAFIKKGSGEMKGTDQLPKSIRKAIRYIKQDAPDHKLIEIQGLVNRSIEERMTKSEMRCK